MPEQEDQETGVEVPTQEMGAAENIIQEPQVVVPVDIREMTRFENEKGTINIIHEVTIGDLLVSTSLVAILIFMVLSRMIRR